MKAIVCSGYGHDPVMSHYREHGFAGVLPKPFGVRELSEVLERKETPRQSSAG